MKLWVILSRCPVTASPHLVAHSCNPDLVRRVVDGLRANWTLETDKHDQIYDQDFIPSAPSLRLALTAAIREDACRQWHGTHPEPAAPEDVRES
jgi:hypothetical protein